MKICDRCKHPEICKFVGCDWDQVVKPKESGAKIIPFANIKRFTDENKVTMDGCIG